jgi:hypothetical protein
MTDEELIARWLESNVPTRCPARFGAPTMVDWPQQENPLAGPFPLDRNDKPRIIHRPPSHAQRE